jgi:hypothetical protein
MEMRQLEKREIQQPTPTTFRWEKDGFTATESDSRLGNEVYLHTFEYVNKIFYRIFYCLFWRLTSGGRREDF